jgi:dTDP-4-amino-4,6-dideoxygalactose transaminase
LIPLAVPDLSGNEAKYLQDCIDSTFVSSVGPFVTRFEAEFASRHGAAAGVAMGAGTLALHAGLMTLGVGPGDLVLVPSFTFIASVNAIAHCGAEPWFVDIDLGSWTMDPAALARALSREASQGPDGRVIHKATGRRIAAILPVFTLGTPADMHAIAACVEQYRLPVLADAAAAVGALYRGEALGGLATLTAFSFNGNKTMTTGGGGMLIGQNRALLAAARHLTTTARVSPDYEHDRVGYNYRMTNVQAALGCAQLERLDDLLAAKRAIRARYDAELIDVGGQAFPSPAWAESGCWFSGRILDRAIHPPVKAVCATLAAQGIEARPFWKPVHLQKPFAHCPKEALPVTDTVWEQVLTLPCSVGLSIEDQAKVIGAVRATLRRR